MQNENDTSIKVIAHPHPFLPSSRTERTFPAGSNIKEIIDSLTVSGLGRPVVMVDGEIADNLDDIPAAGSLVTVRVVPAGNGNEYERRAGEGMKISGFGVMVLGIGLSFIPGFQGWGAFLVYSGISMMGAGILTYTGVLGDLFGQDTGSGGVRSEQLPSIRGGRNRANPWGKIPVIFGKHLVTPLYGARPYTSIATTTTPGDTIYLHQLFVVGLGPLRLSSFKIGETLLATNVAAVRNGAVSTADGSFGGTGDVDMQVYQDGTNPSLYPEVVLEDNPSIELKNANDPDTQWRATAPNTTKASIDITLPRGLYKYNDSGAVANHAVTVVVKRRVFGSGTAWASATTVQTWSLSDSILKTARYTFSEVLSAGQYEYAVHRTSGDDAPDFKGTSMVQWTAMRSIRAGVPAIDASVRSRFVIVALKIKATDKLSGIVDQLNCIAEAEVPIYSGSGSGASSWTGTGFSRNPAALFLAAMRGASNPRAVPAASIDWARLESWYTLCATKNWFGDFVFSQGTRLRDMLNSIASTGRGSFTFRDGLYSAVIDEPKTTPVQHFSPRNVRNFSWTKSFDDKPHALKVNFVSADDGYAPAERIVLDDGYIFDTANDGNLRDWNGNIRTVGPSWALATNFRQVTLPGVTSAELALKQGRYLLAVAKLRPEVYTFDTDIEGIICEPGDLVRVAHDAIAISTASGRIKAVTMSGVTATGITIDEAVTFETGKSYAVRIRRSSDGLPVYAAVNNPAGYYGNELTFTVAIAAGSVPAVGDLFTFGEATIETAPALVVGYEMLDELNMKLYLTDEAAGVHTADSGTIPAYVSRVSRAPSVGVSTAPPTVATVAVEKVVADTKALEVSIPAIGGSMTAPGYVGAFAYAGRPASANLGDTAVLYSSTLSERGIFVWNGTAWAKDTAPSVDMLSSAWPDVSRATLTAAAGGFVGGPYGTVADYVGSGVNVFEVLAVQTAFVDKLLTNFLKVTASLRGGDRYDENGATIDGTKPGFFFSGLTGGCKVAGIEFEGDLGGGVQWSWPTQIGTSLSISASGAASITALSATRVIVAGGGFLRAYDFNGNIWSPVGTPLNMGVVAVTSICALNTSQFAYIDSSSNTVQTYNFTGTTFTTSGSPVSFTGPGVSIATSSKNTISVFDPTNGRLYRYVWFPGTSTYTQQGSVLIGTATLSPLTPLNANDIAIAHVGTTVGQLRVYRWNQTLSTYSQIGGNTTIPASINYVAITSLNGTDIAYIDTASGAMVVMRWNGSVFIPYDASKITLPSAYCGIISVNGSDVALATTTSLTMYRFPLSVSIPFIRSSVLVP